jgi:hypothetical protein
MHSNENSSRILNSLISLLLSPLLMFGPAAVSGASAQDMPSSGDSPAVDAAGATIRKGNIRVDEITTGLEKPKSSGSLGKVVYRDGTVKIDKNEANPGADVKSGSMIEAGADGRALIVLKRKSAANAPLNPEDLLGNRKVSRKKTGDKRTPAKKTSTSVSAQTKPKRKSQPGLSKGIDVKRVQYIALVGDAQAKLDNNEIAIETRDGEAIINQGTSRLFNLGPNSKMRVPSQPKNAITGTLCHGVLTGVAKPSTASGGPNIETSSGIVNFPSGGRFLVEASGSGQLQQCDEVKNGRTDNKGSGGIRVVSLDAPGRLILAQRPVPVAPVKKKPTEAIQDDPKDEKSTEKPITLSLSGTGSSEQEREKDPQEDGSSNKKTADNEKKSNDSEGSKKTADNEKKSNDSDGGKKTADNEKKSNDEDARKKTADNDKKFNDSDGGKKTADSEKRSNDSDTGKKTADTEDKQKSKGGKPTKSEDSPLDIDQGNDKFIGSDSPAAKGAEKRIALNDEKQHDGDGTRQPGEPAKDGKPPQSGSSGDGSKDSKVKQKTEGVLEFGAMEDVKAPELPDMKNMSEQQKKDVYKSMAEKTESAPAPKSLVSNLLGQTSSDPKLVASSDGLSGQSLKGNSDVDGGKETTNKKDSDGSTNGSNAAEGQDKKEKNGSDSEKSKDPNSEDSSKSSDSGKKKSAPLISPPKMSPPPPPKIDATQMPLSSDVLIKLRKKVK